ncbi:hypothetical protein D3C83_16610 [compost metagenome]
MFSLLIRISPMTAPAASSSRNDGKVPRPPLSCAIADAPDKARAAQRPHIRRTRRIIEVREVTRGIISPEPVCGTHQSRPAGIFPGVPGLNPRHRCPVTCFAVRR